MCVHTLGFPHRRSIQFFQLRVILPYFFFLSQAELRASVFEAIEEEDHVIEKEQALPPALLGSCNDRAKQLHASPPGSFLLDP